MRRLYSTFAGGWPGIGLLLMRVVLGVALIVPAATSLWNSSPLNTAIFSALLAGAGILLAAGLWTPVTGILVTLIEIYQSLFMAGDRQVCLLLAAIACSLAMLGPGLWSMDARIFGWKRVEVSLRKR